MLAIARAAPAADERLLFVPATAKGCRSATAAFDVVTCTLALHHFEPPAALELLREMRRVARLTPIVGDLARSHVAFAATWLYTRVTSRNRLTRHDAPLSVRRAYEPEEALTLGARRGAGAPRACSVNPSSA